MIVHQVRHRQYRNSKEISIILDFRKPHIYFRKQSEDWHWTDEISLEDETYVMIPQDDAPITSEEPMKSESENQKPVQWSTEIADLIKSWDLFEGKIQFQKQYPQLDPNKLWPSPQLNSVGEEDGEFEEIHLAELLNK